MLKGLVRGEELFADQAIEISAQAGQMVGVEKEERLMTPLARSLKLRHPWLQINLVTAFVAAGVVGMFEDTLAQLVILAVFLPVMAGQTGNTGCQALAVALRGMTLGELPGLSSGADRQGGHAGLLQRPARRDHRRRRHDHLCEHARRSRTRSGCCGVRDGRDDHRAASIAGLAGAVIPLTLKKLGADPATASSIFLTTASDVVSMGVFLTLSTMFLL